MVHLSSLTQLPLGTQITCEYTPHPARIHVLNVNTLHFERQIPPATLCLELSTPANDDLRTPTPPLIPDPPPVIVSPPNHPSYSPITPAPHASPGPSDIAAEERPFVPRFIPLSELAQPRMSRPIMRPRRATPSVPNNSPPSPSLSSVSDSPPASPRLDRDRPTIAFRSPLTYNPPSSPNSPAPLFLPRLPESAKAPRRASMYRDAGIQTNPTSLRKEVRWDTNDLGVGPRLSLPPTTSLDNPTTRSASPSEFMGSPSPGPSSTASTRNSSLHLGVASAAQVDLPVTVSEIKESKLRGLAEHCRWVESEHTEALPSPLFDALNAKEGLLYLHRYGDNLQIWLRGTSATWSSVTEGVRHPTLPQRYLLVRADGRPSWIDKKTITTYKTRPGKRRVESVGLAASDTEEREAKRRL